MQAVAQTDSAGSVVINKDPGSICWSASRLRSMKRPPGRPGVLFPVTGYRSSILPTAAAYSPRKTKVYQQFPELKPYLMYQAPNYKLKVGNFKTPEEAEEYSKQLSKLFPSGVYVIRDTIEVKPD